jgi:hypothetical protein
MDYIYFIKNYWKIIHLPHFLARLWPFADFDGVFGHQMG